MPLRSALRTWWTTTGQRLQRGLLRQHFFFGVRSASLVGFNVTEYLSFSRSGDQTARLADVDFRNVAIVAHVDHGKTTLVDAMLRQSGALTHRGDDAIERIMDSGDLEREKGITILAKNTAVHRHHPDGSVTVINVIDTPGHADFGGEVERGLSMVDGVLLLVDASEGPLPQTRFVLRKALAAHLPVILVVNKTDRPDARIAEVVESSHDLLLDVASDLDDEAAAAAEHALGLPTLYASGRAGVASTAPPADGQIPDGENLDPLFDVLLEHIPAPSGDPEAPLQALVTNLDASAFLGRLALIRIYNGRLRKGQTVAWMRQVDGAPVITSAKITELLATVGVERSPTDEAIAGDIVAVAGLPDIMIGDTLADPDHAHALPRITVDEPAISVTIGTNTSPLAGKVSGHKLTARMVRNRGWMPSWSATCRSASSTSAGRTPGRCRAAASWRWPCSSSRCAARASS